MLAKNKSGLRGKSKFRCRSVFLRDRDKDAAVGKFFNLKIG